MYIIKRKEGIRNMSVLPVTRDLSIVKELIYILERAYIDNKFVIDFQNVLLIELVVMVFHGGESMCGKNVNIFVTEESLTEIGLVKLRK